MSILMKLYDYSNILVNSSIDYIYNGKLSDSICSRCEYTDNNMAADSAGASPVSCI